MSEAKRRTPRKARHSERGNIVLIAGMLVLALGFTATLTLQLIRTQVDQAATSRLTNFGETMAINVCESLVNAMQHQAQISAALPTRPFDQTTVWATKFPGIGTPLWTTYSIANMARMSAADTWSPPGSTIVYRVYDDTVNPPWITVGATVSVASGLQVARTIQVQIAAVAPAEGGTTYWHVTAWR